MKQVPYAVSKGIDFTPNPKWSAQFLEAHPVNISPYLDQCCPAPISPCIKAKPIISLSNATFIELSENSEPKKSCVSHQQDVDSAL